MSQSNIERDPASPSTASLKVHEIEVTDFDSCWALLALQLGPGVRRVLSS